MMGAEMEVFWGLAGFGMLFFLILVGAGINVYLRGKGTMYANLQRVEVQSLSEKAKDNE